MKTFLIFTLSLLSLNALATCPEFAPLYTQCTSTTDSKIDSIATRSRVPFYSFIITSGATRTRYNIVTDGEPRDVTIQTQDGSETTYIEKASCADGKLVVIRTSEESQDIEQKVYESGTDYLKIHHSHNGSLKSVVSCIL